jgi:long-chain acyl-CoA synthetase
MQDPTPYLDPIPAPRALFDKLEARRNLVRFRVPQRDGSVREVSFGEHAAHVERVAAWLLDIGMGPQDRAAIFAPNRVEWMEAALGIQAAGGAMVPVYASNTAEQAAYVVSHSDARVVFVDTAALIERVLDAWPSYEHVERIVVLGSGPDPLQLAQARRQAGKVTPADDELRARFVGWGEVQARGEALLKLDAGKVSRVLSNIPLDHWGLMLYTSGTSGDPKGVPLTHNNVAVNGADWYRIFYPLVEEFDVDLLWLPFSHIFGLGEANIGNALAWTSTLVDPASVLAKLPEVRPTVFMSVPAYWEKLATLAQAAPPNEQQERLRQITGGRLRFCLSGGAGLKREVKEFLASCGLVVMEGYGLTECSPTLTLNRPDDYRFDSVGKPLPSVELRLAEDGEILARGPSVFGGYHKLPLATAEIFTHDGWLKTGDVGRFTEDGFLQIIDRKKDILVTAGGKNIPPANIERLFQDDPYIAYAVVYGDGKRFVTAGLWLDPAAVAEQLGEHAPAEAVEALVAERVALVNGRLAHHEAIRRYAVIDSPLTVEGGLLTPTLKVKRKKVWEAFRSVFEGLYE